MPRPAAIAGVIAAQALWGADAAAQPAAPAPPAAASADQPPGLTTEGKGFNAPTAAKCAPDQLFRAVVREVSPGLAAADRRAQPRTLYRKGSGYFRADDLPDPVRGDQLSTIVAEPDIWSVNFATRQSQHRTDPGPVLEVHVPILPGAPDTPPLFMTLEYGCEAAFVAAFAARPQRTVAWGATAASLHVASVGDRSLAILMDDRRQEPLMISYLRAGAPVFVVRYDDYRQGMPDRQGLFDPPRWADGGKGDGGKGGGKDGSRGDDRVIPLPDAPPGEAVIPLPREGGGRGMRDPNRPRGGGGKRGRQPQPF